MSQLIIIRGLPGSGKTTYARKVLPSYYLVEADQYFTRPDGVYDFNPKLLQNAHDWVRAEVRRLLKEKCPTVVTGTYTTLPEFQPLLNIAKEADVDVVVFRAEGHYQNVHGVPESTIEKMRARFEDYNGEIYV